MPDLTQQIRDTWSLLVTLAQRARDEGALTTEIVHGGIAITVDEFAKIQVYRDEEIIHRVRKA